MVPRHNMNETFGGIFASSSSSNTTTTTTTTTNSSDVTTINSYFDRYEFRSIDPLTQVAYNKYLKTWHSAHIMEVSEQNKWTCIQMLKANERLRNEKGHLQIETFFESEGKYYMVYEPFPKGAINLLDLMKAKKGERLPEKFVKAVAILLLEYVQVMQQFNIYHRDLKVPNIYVYKSQDNGGEWRIKVKDLRYCIIDPDTSILTCHRGSPAYLAPEVTFPNPFCAIKAETYSLGVILYVLSNGNYPFIGNNPQDLIQAIRYVEASYPSDVNPYLRSFLQLMLHKDPKERASIKNLLNHPWIIQDDFISNQKSSSSSSYSEQQQKIFDYAEAAY